LDNGKKESSSETKKEQNPHTHARARALKITYLRQFSFRLLEVGMVFDIGLDLCVFRYSLRFGRFGDCGGFGFWYVPESIQVDNLNIKCTVVHMC
jgi:hypothetical protein